MRTAMTVACTLWVAAAAWALPVEDGLVLYLDAGQLAGLADGDPVAVWPDLSGQQHDAVQNDSVARPTYVASSAAFNGQPAVAFDGQTTWMALEPTMIQLNAFTLLAVGHFNETSGNQYLVAGQDGSGNDRIRVAWETTSTPVFEYRAGSSGWKNVTAPADTEVHAFGLTGTVEGFLDGVSLGTTSNTSSENPTAFNIGSFNRGQKDFFDGELAVLVLYDRILTADEIAQLSAFLLELASKPRTAAAFNPAPANDAADVWVDLPALTWSGHAASAGLSPRFRVRLATDVNQIEQAQIAPLPVDTNSLAPAEPLSYGTTYFWQVEEANADGSWAAGPVWSFTTEPWSYVIATDRIEVTASSARAGNEAERTVDGSGLEAGLHDTEPGTQWVSADDDTGPVGLTYRFDRAVCLDGVQIWNGNQKFEWILGFGVRNLRIETSLDGQRWDVLEPNAVVPQASGNEPIPVSLTVDGRATTAQFVRLTCLTNWGGTPGPMSLSEVRFLEIPVAARYPQPADGRENVALDHRLQWRPGRKATQHEVYWDIAGEDPNAPIALLATTSDPFLDLDGQTIEYDRRYVWRIDEVNDGQRWPGPVWTYQTPAFVTVDDFESYDNDENRIFDTWIDGWNKPDNGSVVGYETAPFAEQTRVHGGRQSMPLSYDNTGGLTSTTTRTLDGQDWTVGGLGSLVIYWMGRADNGDGALFVRVGSGPRVVCPTPLTATGWTQWTVDLADLGSGLQHVTGITLGVQGSGTGDLLVDDIRLYREAPDPLARLNYVDVTLGDGGNTTQADGGDLVTTADASGTDGLWRLRAFGNAASILEAGGDNAGPTANPEDCPRLVTRVMVPAGRYEVFACFWSDPSAWRVQAALTNAAGDLPLFVAGDPNTGAVQAQAEDFAEPVPLLTESNRTLWIASLGVIDSTGTLEVYWDDDPAHMESNARTWIDGLAYRRAVAP